MALRLLSLTHRYGKQLALDNVSLCVPRGACYGFIGHNGAGKTTAIRIALGLIRPQSGRVVVDGFDAARHPREARARMGGLVEIPGFYGWWSGRKNLAILARLQGFGRREARDEAGRLLEAVGLEGAGDKHVRAYSQGMRQRLGIAQALIGNPPYVILDEPTSGLDPEGIAQVRDLLGRLINEHGTTVLLSSHQLREISDLCTWIGVLRQGRLLVEKETAQLLGGGSGRYRLVTESDHAAPAAARLAKLGVDCQRHTGGELLLNLGERDPAEVARALVKAGTPLVAFAPRPLSLEEIYLRYATGAGGDEPPPPPPSAPKTPDDAEPVPDDVASARLRWPIWRVLRYEAQRWGGRAAIWLLLMPPALLAALGIVRRSIQARNAADQVEQGTVFSTTDVTAFEGMAVGLQAALLLAAIVAASLASQSVAAELARGTLRNVLLRPVGRIHVAAGKTLALLGAALATLALLVATAWVAATWAFDFTAVFEVLPNGQRYPLVSAQEIWPQLGRALLSPLAPLAAYSGLGFLAGAVSRSAAGALGLALGSVVFLDLARTVARPLGCEGWLPSAHLPSPLSDTSFVQFYADIATGVSNASFEYPVAAVIAPVVWAVAAFLLASVVLMRRSVP